MTGAAQERWLLDRLGRSRARWNVLAQQTIAARHDDDPGEGVSFNHDQWDGYEGARDRLLGFVEQARVANPVVLTGDWRSSWVNDLKADFTDPASATVASEFVGTSISSGCPWAPDVAAALPANPHVRFFDGERRGWVRCRVTPERWTSDFRVVAAPDDLEAPAQTLTSWVVQSGEAGGAAGVATPRTRARRERRSARPARRRRPRRRRGRTASRCSGAARQARPRGSSAAGSSGRCAWRRTRRRRR